MEFEASQQHPIFPSPKKKKKKAGDVAQVAFA
jgi:hypothetical protein